MPHRASHGALTRPRSTAAPAMSDIRWRTWLPFSTSEPHLRPQPPPPHRLRQPRLGTTDRDSARRGAGHHLSAAPRRRPNRGKNCWARPCAARRGGRGTARTRPPPGAALRPGAALVGRRFSPLPRPGRTAVRHRPHHHQPGPDHGRSGGPSRSGTRPARDGAAAPRDRVPRRRSAGDAPGRRAGPLGGPGARPRADRRRARQRQGVGGAHHPRAGRGPAAAVRRPRLWPTHARRHWPASCSARGSWPRRQSAGTIYLRDPSRLPRDVQQRFTAAARRRAQGRASSRVCARRPPKRGAAAARRTGGPTGDAPHSTAAAA